MTVDRAFDIFNNLLGIGGCENCSVLKGCKELNKEHNITFCEVIDKVEK